MMKYRKYIAPCQLSLSFIYSHVSELENKMMHRNIIQYIYIMIMILYTRENIKSLK